MGPDDLPPVFLQIIRIQPAYTDKAFAEMIDSPNDITTPEAEEIILRRLKNLIAQSPFTLNSLPVSSVEQILVLLKKDSMRSSDKRDLFVEALRELVRKSGYEITDSLELKPKNK